MRIGEHINLTKYLIETYNKSIGHYRLLWIKGNLYILATFVSKEQLEDAKRLDQYKVSDLEIEPWKTEKEMPFKKTRKDLLNPMANIKFERNVAYKDADEMLKTIGVSSEEQNYQSVCEAPASAMENDDLTTHAAIQREAGPWAAQNVQACAAAPPPLESARRRQRT